MLGQFSAQTPQDTPGFRPGLPCSRGVFTPGSGCSQVNAPGLRADCGQPPAPLSLLSIKSEQWHQLCPCAVSRATQDGEHMASEASCRVGASPAKGGMRTARVRLCRAGCGRGHVEPFRQRPGGASWPFGRCPGRGTCLYSERLSDATRHASRQHEAREKPTPPQEHLGLKTCTQVCGITLAKKVGTAQQPKTGRWIKSHAGHKMGEGRSA